MRLSPRAVRGPQAARLRARRRLPGRSCPGHRGTATDRLPHLPGQAPRRRPGRLHTAPHQGPDRSRPPRRGVLRPALSDRRRAGPAPRAAEPRHLQRPLPDADAGIVGAEELRGLARGHHVLERELPRAARLQRAGGPEAAQPGQPVRPRAGQPMPRLRAAGDGASRSPGARNDPPPDHRRPRARDGALGDAVAEVLEGPVVRVHEDADAGRPTPHPHRHGLGELPQGHHQRARRRPRPDARRPCRGRPGPLPPPTGGGADPGSAHHHR